MIAASASALGVLGGFLISWRVEDETSWYPRWFFWLGLAGLAAAFGLVLYSDLASPVWTLHVVLLGILVYGYTKANPWLVFGALAVDLAWADALLPAELALAGLVPATGWLYSRGARWSLLWALLIPTVITAYALL